MNYSICVSGAAGGRTVAEDKVLAAAVGQEIARQGHVLTTGATVGLPYYAAKAAHQAGGTSIGFSPAVNIREHLHKYRLPIGVYDFVNYTGMHYLGRDVYLVQSSDAVITIGGRTGSLHELSTAIEARRVCGILTGSDGLADFVTTILDKLEVGHRKLFIFDDDPKRLVDKVVAALDKEYADIDIKDELAHWYLDSDEPNKPIGRSHTG
ncbi:MAG: hypothetical protein ABI221_03155 [Candidatus Saccharimonadales bacterium]